MEEIKLNLYSPSSPNQQIDQIQFNLYSPEAKQHQDTNEIKLDLNGSPDENMCDLLDGFPYQAAPYTPVKNANQSTEPVVYQELQCQKQTSLDRLADAWKYLDENQGQDEPEYNLNLTKCTMEENQKSPTAPQLFMNDEEELLSKSSSSGGLGFYI